MLLSLVDILKKLKKMIKKIEKFGASWCGPCRMLDKTLSQVSEVEIVKFDADDDAELFEANNVKSVPLMLFKDENDEVVQRVAGLVSIDYIRKVISDNK